MARSKKTKTEVAKEAVIATPKKEAILTIGKVKEVVAKLQKESLCTACAHVRVMHYGGSKEWCNTSGCQCQEYTEK